MRIFVTLSAVLLFTSATQAKPLFGVITQATGNILNTASEATKDAVNAATNVVTTVGNTATNVATTAADTVTNVATTVADTATDTATTVVNERSKIVDSITNTLNDQFDQIKNDLEAVVDETKSEMESSFDDLLKELDELLQALQNLGSLFDNLDTEIPAETPADNSQTTTTGTQQSGAISHTSGAKAEPMFISQSAAFKFVVGDTISLPCEVTHPECVVQVDQQIIP
uniref:Putative secreted protein n=1 Tax=Lutzomyia longipalpis TaxID=7200 RepID=A0A1B0CD00_LUTLO